MRNKIPAAFILVYLGLVASAGMASCTTRVPVSAGPAAQRAGTALDVITHLGELQSLVIDLNHKGRIGDNDARAIVEIISGDTRATPPKVGLVEVLQTAPTGWKSTALNAWYALRPYLDRNSEIAPWVPILNDLVAGL